MSIVLVQGDTRPTITAILHDQTDPTAVLDLRTVLGVTFKMRKPDDRHFTVNAAASIPDAAHGGVAYQFGPNDLNVPGDYQIEWEVTYADGGTQTTATPVPVTVRRA